MKAFIDRDDVPYGYTLKEMRAETAALKARISELKAELMQSKLV